MLFRWLICEQSEQSGTLANRSGVLRNSFQQENRLAAVKMATPKYRIPLRMNPVCTRVLVPKFASMCSWLSPALDSIRR